MPLQVPYHLQRYFNLKGRKIMARKQHEISFDEKVEILKTYQNKEIKAHDIPKWYDLMFVDAIARASDEVLEMTLHKMIVHCTNLPFDFRQKSADWLLDRGLRLDLWGDTE